MNEKKLAVAAPVNGIGILDDIQLCPITQATGALGSRCHCVIPHETLS
jgi:hypothetical protein